MPVLGTTPYNINVQEDALPTGNPDTTSDTTTGTITYANLSGLVHVGADEPAQFSLNTSVSGAVQTTGGSDVYSQGSLVSYHVNGSVIEGKSADGRVVFTLTQTAGSSTADPTDDEFTYELKDQLDHPVPGSTDDDQTMVLNLSPAIVATDKDADPISLGSQLTVTVEDDVPVLGTTPYNINVQEDALPTGNPDTTSDTTTGTITYANLSGLVHVGADEPAQFSLNTSVSGAVQTTGGSDVYSQGSLVSYHVNGSVIEGKSADGRIVFTLTQTAGSSTADPTDDEFTYELKDQLDHPVPGSTDDDQTMVLNLSPAIVATDKDADPISLGSQLTVTVEDDVPVLGTTPYNINVQEDALSTGNPDTTSDTTTGTITYANLSGLVHVGADEPAQFSLNTSVSGAVQTTGGSDVYSQGSLVSYHVNGSVIEGKSADGRVVFTLTQTAGSSTADPTDDEFTYELKDQLDHPVPGSTDDDQTMVLNLSPAIVATDKDADPISLGSQLTVTVEDDVPVLGTTPYNINVQEDALSTGNPDTTSDTTTGTITYANLSGLVHVGADEPAQFSLNTSVSGAVQTTGGSDVYSQGSLVSYHVNGSVIEGKSADGRIVFTLTQTAGSSTADPTDDEFTYELKDQLDHPVPGSTDDDQTMVLNLSPAIVATDKDADPISLGSQLTVTVEDDVPVLGTTPYNINVQEDALPTGNPDTTSDTTTGTITYANLSGLVHVGADEPAQFSLNTSVSGAVQTTGGSDVYSQGSLVSYHVNGSVIEGKSADGRIVFTLTQTAGSSTADPTDDEFTYELKDQLDHPVPGSTDDDQTMVLNLSPAIVATDKDADPISLGSQLTVTVEDDVPVLGTTPYNINVQEDALPTGNPDTTSDTTTGTITYANLSGLVHVGADEPAQFSLNTSVSGAVQTTGGSDVYSQGSLVSYHVNGSVIEGKSADGRIVFTLTQTAGSSTADPTDDEFTYELKDQLDHPVPGSTDDDQTMVLNLSPAIVATDKDADPISLGSQLTVTVEDDVPVLGTTPYNINVQEDALPTGNPDTTSDTTTGTITYANLSGLVHVGADEPAQFSLNTSVSGAVQTTGGSDVYSQGSLVSYHVNGSVIEGKSADGRIVFTLTQTAGSSTADPTDDEFTYELKDQLDHPVPGSTDDDQTMVLNLSPAIVATDKDADPISLGSQLTVTVEDDVPVLGTTPYNINVQEDALSTGNPDTTSDTTTGTITYANLSGLVHVGADEPAQFSLNTSVSGAVQTTGGSDVYSQGSLVSYHVNGSVIEGKSADGRVVFTLTQTAGSSTADPTDDEFTYELKDQLDHPVPGSTDDDQTMVLNLSPAIVATDKDADPISLGSQLTVTVEDDVPVLGTTPYNINVQEDALPTGNPDTTSDTTTGTITYANLSGLVHVGADEPAQFSLNTSVSGAVQTTGGSDVYSQGSLVSYHVNGSVIEGKSADGRIVFTLTQTAGSSTADPTDDEFTYELKDQLDHPVPGSTDDDQTMVLNLSPAIVATDKDADPISLGSQLTVTVEDDVPVLGTTPYNINVQEDALPTGNPDTTSDTTTGTITYANLSGLVHVGADEPAQFSLNTSVSGAVQTTGGSDVYSQGSLVSYHVNGSVIEGKSADGRVVFTLTQTAGSSTADPTDDEFTYELKDQLDHPVPGSTDDDQTMVLNLSPAIVATDKDADPISLGSQLTVTVENDVPVLVDDSSSLAENEATVTGNVLGNDTIGADEHSGGDMVVSKVVFNGSEFTPTSAGISITGVYGELRISADGAWSYTSNDSVDHTDTQPKVDTFTYSVIDADGDEVTADLKLTVTDLGPSIVPDNVAVDESNFGTSIQTTTVALHVSTPADSIDDVRFEDPGTGQSALNALGLKTSDDDSSLSYSLSTSGHTLTAKDGGTTVFDVVISESGGSYYYTYTQYEALEHKNGTTLLESLDLPFVFEAEDIDGSISRGTGTVTVVDDEPQAVADYDASTTLEDQAWYSVTEGGFTLTADDSDDTDADTSNNILLLNDDAGADGGLKIVGFSFTDEWGDVQTTGVPGTEADTIYGKITIAEDGSFAYTSDPYADHTTHEFLLDTVTYTVEDADGDQSIATFKIKVEDLRSSITAPAGLTFDERYLPTGSDPKPSETSGSQSISFTRPSDPVNVVFAYHDGDEIADAHMYRTTFGQPPAPKFGDLTSGSQDVKYTISSDYRTITAYIDDNGTTGYQDDDTAVFTVELTGYTNSTDFDNSSDLGYTFTLFEPLDHTATDNIKMQFTVGIYDANEINLGINDWQDIPVTINILDDEPATTKSMTVLEDSSDPDGDPSHPNTITTSADADSGDISIPSGSGPLHGTATVNANGTISYTPNPDYSGTDTFTYEYTDENTSAPISVSVTVTVTPVSDAPGVQDDYSVGTNEDTSVALGLTAPTIKDATDANGSGSSGDDPERLGLITISGIPEGARVFKADGTLIFTGTSTDHDFTVQLNETGTDGQSIHINGVSGEVVLSIADFNALRILPPADDATDFTVKMSVTEYEVNASGDRVNAPTDTNGETAETEVTVNVSAVTDRVDLKWIDEADEPPYDQADPVDDDTFGTVPDSTDEIKDTVEDGTLNKYIDEGDTLNLSQLLEFNANDPGVDYTDLTTTGQNGDDDDGSEDRWLVLDDLPAGFVVTADGSSISPENDGTYIIPLVNNDNDLPSIIISPPSDFSGEVTDYSIALYTKDTDADTTVTTVEKSDEVSLNLYIMPQAGDVSAPDVSTSEDTPVKFLENLVVTDTSGGVGNGGLESITSITVSNVPAGWVIRDGSGNAVSSDGAGNYTISTSTYAQYTITPPAHSSADGVVRVSVTTEDSASVQGSTDTDTKTTDLDISIKVTPVAERIGTDSNEDGQTDDISASGDQTIADTDENDTADLQMNPSYSYSTSGNEDEWFDLSEDGAFKLQDGWINAGTSSNEDSDEDTYALLTPLDSSDNPLIGAQFSLDGTTVYATYSGSSVQIPVDDLDDLQFRPPANYAADDIQIKVEAKTVDTDPDDSSTNTQISGEVYLTLNVGPAADQVTLQANTPGGYEDDAIPLYIKPSSSDKDGSETYTIKIADIPEGAKIEYWDASSSSYQTFTASTATTELSISRFDQTKDLTITPPVNSNDDFVLQVSGKSVDTVGTTIVESGLSDPLPLEVSVRGVADLTADVVTTARYSEADVDVTMSNEIPLLESTNGPWQSLALTDTDGSETMSVMLSDLPDDFSLSGSGLVFLGGAGSDRHWIVSQSDLDNVKIVTPEHFSGTITLKGTPMTTENDGHTLSAADGFTDNPNELTLTVEVIPSPESTLVAETIASEDTLTKLDMSLVGPDSSESLTSVKIKIDDVDHADFTLYWGNSTTITLASAASDSSITQVSKDSSGEYYEITGAAAVENIYVVGAADSHGGPYDVEVKYTVTDTTDDGTLTDESDEKFATHSVTITAVTDDITETLGSISVSNSNASISGSTVDLTGNTELTIPVTVSQQDQDEAGDVGMNGVDDDGSETLLRFEITNVPEGVSVDGATYSGDVYNPTTGGYENSGRWIIEVDESFSSQDIQKDIVLKVDGSWDELQGLSDQVVTIRAYSADDGDEETFAAQTVTLNVTDGDVSSFAGVPESYPSITTWNSHPVFFTSVEDTASPLNEMIDSSSVELGGSGDFTVTISGLPAGSSVQGFGAYQNRIESFSHNGQTVWTVSGSGDTSGLQDLLANVTITPPPDYNSNNNAPLDFDLTLTTYGGSSQENAVLDVVRDVVPDSDTTSVEITAADVGEEVRSTTITVKLENDADDSHTILQNGKLYIQLDENGMTVAGGSLALVSGGANMATVTNPTGLPTGTYYEISGVTYGSDVQLAYTSANDDASGSIGVTGYVLTSEENEPVDDVDILVGSGSGVFTVAPYVDGYDFEVENSSGDEFSGGVATSADRIALNVVNNGLLDTDGSETVVSAILTGVPNGFLVYAGDGAASATMALNGGDDGSSTNSNRWILPLDSAGMLPDYIGIQPPEDVSCSFELQLGVTVQESDGSERTDSDTFNLVVNPIAYPIDPPYFNPTDTFGDEGDMVPINLNVSLGDTVDFYPPENGVDDLETVTMTLKGMGPYASFYDAHGSYIDSVSYDDGTDTYTLSGIPADQVNAISFVQAAFDGEVNVTAYTVDGTDTSEDEKVSDQFTATVNEVLPTIGDDVLLYDGIADADGSRNYDALEGNDTLLMRNSEDLDFDDSPDISNMEVLDMSNDTANVISNLSPEDVLDITDGANELFIDADGKDSVLGDPGSTWTQEADQSIGGTTYEVYSATVSTAGGPETVTLYVDNEASISL